jgi:hypothetical protein
VVRKFGFGEKFWACSHKQAFVRTGATEYHDIWTTKTVSKCSLTRDKILGTLILDNYVLSYLKTKTLSLPCREDLAVELPLARASLSHPSKSKQEVTSPLCAAVD